MHMYGNDLSVLATGLTLSASILDALVASTAHVFNVIWMPLQVHVACDEIGFYNQLHN